MTQTPIRYGPNRAPGANEVRVCIASMQPGTSELAALWETLAEDERVRAARYRFETDRQRFIVARGKLRSLLGHYLRTLPDRMVFGYGPAGKPEVLKPRLGRRLGRLRSMDRK